MQTAELAVEARPLVGTGPARRLRRDGEWVPAVVYGKARKNVNLRVRARDLSKVLGTQASANVLLSLKATGTAGAEVGAHPVLVREVQIHPVTRRYLHVDFYEVLPDQKIRIRVPLVLVGEPEGLKQGGILQQVTRWVDLECLPAAIPERIEINVTPLKIGHSFHARDLKVAEGVRVRMDEGQTLVAMVAPMTEEEMKAMEAAATAPPEGAQPKVVGEEEKAAAAAEGAPAAAGEEKKPAAEGGKGAAPAAKGAPAGKEEKKKS